MCARLVLDRHCHCMDRLELYYVTCDERRENKATGKSRDTSIESLQATEKERLLQKCLRQCQKGVFIEYIRAKGAGGSSHLSSMESAPRLDVYS